MQKIIWTNEMIKELANPDIDTKEIAYKYNIDFNLVRTKRKIINYNRNIKKGE